MPIFRYFLFVGGALLALLLAVNFALPASPVTQAVATAGNDQPLIRIRSDRHLPERVVLDTSQPTIAAPAVKTAAVVAPQPPVQDAASAALAEMSAKARVRGTFAQFTPAPKANAAAARKTEAKPQVQAQAQLPAIDVLEHRILLRVFFGTDDGPPLPHVVERTRAFDLDHLRAHICEYVTRDCTRPDPAEIDDAYSGERPGMICRRAVFFTAGSVRASRRFMLRLAGVVSFTLLRI